MGYPDGLLSTRAIVKPGIWAMIPPDGLVNNVIPGIENSRVSIIASPKMGAGFVEYVAELQPGGGAAKPWAAQEGIESFVYVISGTVGASAGGETKVLSDGGYVYSTPGTGISFVNTGSVAAKILMYKQRYVPLEGYSPETVWGNTNDIPFRIYDDMENVMIKDLLPSAPGFDMNMHILAFEPGGCHPFAETHVQEHGAYVLGGEGMYFMDDRWFGVKKDDFLWFGAYVAQCAYGVGRERFEYIYSKDCFRDAQI